MALKSTENKTDNLFRDLVSSMMEKQVSFFYIKKGTDQVREALGTLNAEYIKSNLEKINKLYDPNRSMSELMTHPLDVAFHYYDFGARDIRSFIPINLVNIGDEIDLKNLEEVNLHKIVD